MNPEGFAVFIPIVALCIPVAGIIFHGMEKIARLRVEEAKVKSGQPVMVNIALRYGRSASAAQTRRRK